MYAGIDLGTTYVKTHTGLSFPSGISNKYIDMASNVMSLGNGKYAMELLNEKSDYGVNVNKSLNSNIYLNYIYALYKLSQTEDAMYKNAVVGLPCSQWKVEDIVNDYRGLLNLQNPIKVKVNNIEKTIQVDNIDIAPEGATAYYAMDYERFDGMKTLLLDFGGLTLNQILFQNNEIIDVETFEDGVLKVYQEMSSEINSYLGTNLKIEDMYDILTKGYFHKGVEMDIKSYTNPIAINYCDRIYKKLKLRWGIDSIKHVPLIGAGSITMEKHLKYFCPQTELQEDAQILAAKGMEMIARECS